MANNYARGAPANVQEEEHQQPLAADLDRANDEYWMNLWSNNNRAPANVQEEEHQQPLAADLDRANDEYWMNLWSNNNRAPANVQEEEHQQPLAADLDRANDEYWMNLWSNNNRAPEEEEQQQPLAADVVEEEEAEEEEHQPLATGAVYDQFWENIFSNATMTNNADIIVVEEEPEQQHSVTADVVEEEEAEEEEHQPLATEVTNDDGGNANIANNADIIVIKDEDEEEELQQPSATYDDHEYDTYSTFATAAANVLDEPIVEQENEIQGYGQVESRYDPWNNHHARRFLVVKLSEKRKMYVVNHVKMESIEVYHNPAGIDFDVSLDSFFGPNNAINKRVSLYTGDIRCLEIDAIVNAANESLLGGGGVDDAIHKAAGESLKKECELLGGCRPGYAKISGGHRLPAKYVIHTVGPRNKDGEILKSCYTNVFSLVREKNIKTIAFPCIVTGDFGFSIEEACNIALKTTRDWLEGHHEEVERIIFCVFDEDTKKIYAKLMKLYFPAPTNLTLDGYLPGQYILYCLCFCLMYLKIQNIPAFQKRVKA
ncbi:uncharacterized protein [Clytia hemisphaerica]|uniref:uncharacterized protein isoform X5 n=1 Tax=Clytia hemisphaerica TaxID=252671 RepID=UPI0034D524CF